MTLLEELLSFFEGRYEHKPYQEEQPKPFLRSPDWFRTKNLYAGAVRNSLRRFMSIKRNDPTALAGDDRPFVGGGLLARAVPGLRHAHLSQDVSVVYAVRGGQVYLYGLYPHKELGTGNTGNRRKQQQMAERFRGFEFR